MDTVASAPSGAPCRIVEAEGELDLATALSFRATLCGNERDNATSRWHLIVDLTRVSFMDGSPLHELCAARSSHEARGGWIRVVYTHASIALLFRVAGLTEVFPRYASVDDARQDRCSQAYE